MVGGAGLVAPIAERLQQVFGLARWAGEPGISEREDEQRIGKFCPGIGRAQRRLYALGHVTGAGLHGGSRWQELFQPPQQKILEDIQ